jgi:hypothetical protein
VSDRTSDARVFRQRASLLFSPYFRWFAGSIPARLVGENVLRVSLPKGIAGNRQACEIMIDQSRAIDNQRFMRKLKKLPKPILREVKDKLRLLAEV